ncbi:MAG: iron-sulfur cluster assembly scaffold protein [Balneolales bacterium]|nr:iron-sulfur cluster assembly scaffold protein [Balneolales bacterium]
MAVPLDIYTRKLIAASKLSEYQLSDDQADTFRGQKNLLSSAGKNPVCGDKIEWFISLHEDEETIKSVHCYAEGCIMLKSSANLLANLATGKTAGQIKDFYSLLKAHLNDKEQPLPKEQEVERNPWLSLIHIRNYPARQKCITLPWNTLIEALS